MLAWPRAVPPRSRAILLRKWEGAVAGLILRLRHSPGVTRRRATQDASETGCASDSTVCVESRFLPLRRELHAMCQRGADRNRVIRCVQFERAENETAQVQHAQGVGIVGANFRDKPRRRPRSRFACAGPFRAELGTAIGNPHSNRESHTRSSRTVSGSPREAASESLLD